MISPLHFDHPLSRRELSYHMHLCLVKESNSNSVRILNFVEKVLKYIVLIFVEYYHVQTTATKRTSAQNGFNMAYLHYNLDI